MIRFALYSLALAVVLVTAGWFAAHPGHATIDWLGYRIEAPVGLLILAVALVALVVTLGLRFLFFMAGAPSRLAAWRAARRRRLGYAALSRGMVAVAAGDASAARIAARRAEGLLAAGETPLPLLLAAQSAQLQGDEGEAQRCFTAMLERPETEFLGLRGLLSQAARAGDLPRALTLARRAHALKPDTPWVLTALIDLAIRQGEWHEAEQIVARAARRKVLSPARAERDLAILAYAQSLQAERAGHGDSALRHAKRAHQLAPAMAPLTARLAVLLIRDGQRRAAARAIEQTWPLSPQPELARLYGEARPQSDPLKRFGRIERLAKLAPDHLESRLALARAALDAQLWGKARSELNLVTGTLARDESGAALGDGAALDPPARAFRLLAELEEAEHGDGSAMRLALERAGFARPDETWTCRECGARTAEWTPLCPSCQAFDSLEWVSPRALAGLATTAGAPLSAAREGGPGDPAVIGPHAAAPGLTPPDVIPPRG